jgi:hypothetical protein
MGFKTFTAGSVLTAAEVNDYLMKQAVIVCTSGTRPGSPVDGMTIYETDTDRLLVWNGTNWTAYRIGNEPDRTYAITLSNGTATSLTDFVTQNSILSLPYPYTMLVQALINSGANAGANYASIQVRDETGANINYSKGTVATDWSNHQAAASNDQVWGAFGKKDYAAAATCGFRLAYKVNTSNIYMDGVVRVSFVPR